ncbi:hypothetical protein OR16_24960 [Cupriavidus basilensis OR16]|uniref:Uncharacterized protein n=1 Tax=Cupriavidus basilensis OR16 TaxID=1127483 RepID=H1SA71_9BURK|nr:hypothetical protein OR16_24960 [Cupriavidus basilensis OR16]
MWYSLTQLHREVRSMSRRLHEQATAQARGDNSDYFAYVLGLVDDLIYRGDARERVVCFASAAEFGISMQHQSERCLLAAMQTGSDAIRVLYWTAVRRLANCWTRVSQSPNSEHSETGNEAHHAGSHKLPAVHKSGASTASRKAALCRRCEELRMGSRNASGHSALYPISERYFQCIGGSVFSEAIQHRCSMCATAWTQHRNAASPFVNWSQDR